MERLRTLIDMQNKIFWQTGATVDLETLQILRESLWPTRTVGNMATLISTLMNV